MVVYVVWGSTYLAIRVVVEDMPPLISAGSRFLTAALLMGTFLAIQWSIVKSGYYGHALAWIAAMIPGAQALTIMDER